MFSYCWSHCSHFVALFLSNFSAKLQPNLPTTQKASANLTRSACASPAELEDAPSCAGCRIRLHDSYLGVPRPGAGVGAPNCVAGLELPRGLDERAALLARKERNKMRKLGCTRGQKRWRQCRRWRLLGRPPQRSSLCGTIPRSVTTSFHDGPLSPRRGASCRQSALSTSWQVCHRNWRFHRTASVTWVSGEGLVKKSALACNRIPEGKDNPLRETWSWPCEGWPGPLQATDPLEDVHLESWPPTAGPQPPGTGAKTQWTPSSASSPSEP